jgi:hypothetical protein
MLLSNGQDSSIKGEENERSFRYLVMTGKRKQLVGTSREMYLKSVPLESIVRSGSQFSKNAS